MTGHLIITSPTILFPVWFRPVRHSLDISSGHTVTLNGAGLDNKGTLSISGGTLNGSGAAVNAASISGYGVIASASLVNGAGGSITLTGGTSTVTSSVANSGAINVAVQNASFLGDVTTYAGGSLVISGGSTTTFAGTFDVKSGGAFNVVPGSNAIFTGSVFLRSGAIISGIGFMSFQGSLSVGASPGLAVDPGSVSFGAANEYLADIGGLNPGDDGGVGIEYDRLVVGGRLTFGGTLRVSRWNGFAPQAGQKFDLFDWGTAQGSFSSIDFTNAPLASGLTWDTSNLYTTGELSVAAAVPEPESWAMLLGGFALTGFLARRRARREASVG